MGQKTNWSAQSASRHDMWQAVAHSLLDGIIALCCLWYLIARHDILLVAMIVGVALRFITRFFERPLTPLQCLVGACVELAITLTPWLIAFAIHDYLPLGQNRFDTGLWLFAIWVSVGILLEYAANALNTINDPN